MIWNGLLSLFMIQLTDKDKSLFVLRYNKWVEKK